MTVNPSEVAFNSVAVGTSSSHTVTVSNTGTASATISQVSVTGAGFSISGPQLPLILAAGQGAGVSIVFAPEAAGAAAGTIAILSNASNSPATVSLSGTATEVELSGNPSSLSFGNVTVGSNGSNVMPFVVTNIGSASVTISQASVSGAGFSVSGPSLPLTLPAGQNTSFSVSFDPTSAGTVTGSVSVVSNASNSPTVASLSGTGVGQHSVILSWTASTSSGVAGYNVYRGQVSGGPYVRLNSSVLAAMTYTDATVQAGQTYYYVATTLNSQGVESGYSSQAQALIPSP